METHRDDDALRALAARAREMVAKGESQITAGAPGEVPLSEYTVGKFLVRRLPDDPLALRISIGGGGALKDGAYLVFRGDPAVIKRLLTGALDALQPAIDQP